MAKAKRFPPVLLASFDLEPGAIGVFNLQPPSNVIEFAPDKPAPPPQHVIIQPGEAYEPDMAGKDVKQIRIRNESAELKGIEIWKKEPGEIEIRFVPPAKPPNGESHASRKARERAEQAVPA